MATIALDTYKLINRLKINGFSEEQARGVTEAIQEIDLDHLVTKADLKTEMAGLKSEMAELKSDIFKWPVPLMLGQAGLTAAFIKFLH